MNRDEYKFLFYAVIVEFNPVASFVHLSIIDFYIQMPHKKKKLYNLSRSLSLSLLFGSFWRCEIEVIFGERPSP
jgi:hypothetical protein